MVKVVLLVLFLAIILRIGVVGVAIINNGHPSLPTGWISHQYYHLLQDVPTYNLTDATGFGLRYDGIGGLSGGGATSKLLINYKEPQRTQILDYLFKPNFGASLQILKVEIGGDDQSSDGGESSHMHTADEENYNTGYEWWLMKQAKQRNPDIKLYGLAWSFPGWIGDGILNPYQDVCKLSRYLVNWVKGAQQQHNLTIDYLGVWNERPINATAITSMRALLDSEGLYRTHIVGGDGGPQECDNMCTAVLNDTVVRDAVDVISIHYPGTYSRPLALKTGKPLWASEDYSTYNDNTGAGCWARILNQNYVNGNMTSTIAWNLIASYYDDLAWTRNSLMTANEPWSGHYILNNPVWVTAHTTQFTDIGWRYLKHGAGVGHLAMGGSYVALTSAEDPSNTLTIVVETFQHNHSICIRPALPPYDVADYQQAVFQLGGSFLNITTVHVWMTRLGYGGKPDMSVFKYAGPQQVKNGQIVLGLYVDMLVTVTTVSSGNRGTVPSIPASQAFPLPYKDNFDSYSVYAEPYNFAQQIGVFEVRKAADPKHGQVMQQVLTRPPIAWCGGGSLKYPQNLIGNYNWTNVSASVDMMVPNMNESTEGAYLALRVNDSPPNGGQFGCYSDNAVGLFLSVIPKERLAVLTGDANFQTVLMRVSLDDLRFGDWITISMNVTGSTCTAYYNSKKIFSYSVNPKSPLNGFVAVGTMDFGVANFDNLIVMG